jgi:RimJ/RimL family protein N-acetyltransferase
VIAPGLYVHPANASPTDWVVAPMPRRRLATSIAPPERDRGDVPMTAVTGAETETTFATLESVGAPLSVRPLTPSDRDGVAALFERLSPESRHHRFLAPKPRLSARELDYLASVDHVRHDALAAVDERDRSIVAIVRYVQVPGRPGVADVAAEVADHLHNLGIASTLALLAVDRARANGFTTLTATVLWDNQPARAILRRLGFRACASVGATLDLELRL